MKIAFLGNFREPYTSESHYLKSLRELGHEVFLLQEGIDDINQIMKRASQMDLFFWVHTHGWKTAGIEEGLKQLKGLGIPTVGYHLDLWMGIERQRDLETDPYWKLDYFFSVDKLMVDYLNSRPDMPKAFYMPAGVFGQECFIGEKKSEYAFDVIFVGSKRYHPEWQYRTELVEWLENTYEDRFGLFGREGINKGQIRGHELNSLYASAKIVVGDTLCKGFDYPYYLSDRIFETTGRGGFIIHPYIKGLEDLFELPKLEGNHLDTSKAEIVTYPFGNFEYLKYLIDYFLENEEEREAIRMRGHEKSKVYHTYANRLNYMLEVIQNERK